MKKRISRNCDDSKYTVPDDTTHSIDIGSISQLAEKNPLTCPDRPQRMRQWKQAITEANTNRWLVFNDIQRAENMEGSAQGQGPRIIRIYQVSLHPTWSNGHPKGNERCESTASGRIAATSHCTSDIQEAAKFSQSLWYSAMLYCYTLETLDLLYIKSLPWIMLEPKQREENGLIATLGSASSASPNVWWDLDIIGGIHVIHQWFQHVSTKLEDPEDPGSNSYPGGGLLEMIQWDQTSPTWSRHDSKKMCSFWPGKGKKGTRRSWLNTSSTWHEYGPQHGV